MTSGYKIVWALDRCKSVYPLLSTNIMLSRTISACINANSYFAQ